MILQQCPMLGQDSPSLLLFIITIVGKNPTRYQYPSHHDTTEYLIPQNRKWVLNKKSYGRTRYNPFQGVCQGNRSGPGILILVCAFLFQYVIQEGHNVYQVLYISGIKRSLTALILVQYTNIFTQEAT